ncbi:MAG: 16S rRNA (guanine(527)-N(7))-methyltransferase RsmG [Parvularcula sp.]|jgi:16S rRNA (guanine527-N7)-methyltransferase|nr:16S rRNA (guanine(527)-N(7))-methyltransferase RsmG [Parvularcula sp.]
MPREGFADFCSAFSLTPTERAAFEAFDGHLTNVNAHTNLIARSSSNERWSRHYADSAQLFDLIPADARTLLDVGSGAGFPGIVLAILAQTRRPDVAFTLCESIQKKATFLREASQAAGLRNLNVQAVRVETLPSSAKFDVITARAVTSLDSLMGLAAPRLAGGGTMIFPKGRRAQVELDEARKQWSFKFDRRASMTDPEAAILLIEDAKPTHRAPVEGLRRAGG